MIYILLDSRAKNVVLVLGDADNAFRSTSVARERNDTSSKRSVQNSMVVSSTSVARKRNHGGVESNNLLSRFSFSRET